MVQLQSHLQISNPDYQNLVYLILNLSN